MPKSARLRRNCVASSRDKFCIFLTSTTAIVLPLASFIRISALREVVVIDRRPSRLAILTFVSRFTFYVSTSILASSQLRQQGRVLVIQALRSFQQRCQDFFYYEPGKSTTSTGRW